VKGKLNVRIGDNLSLQSQFQSIGQHGSDEEQGGYKLATDGSLYGYLMGACYRSGECAHADGREAHALEILYGNTHLLEGVY
jgi:hypothetical protein